LTRPRDDSTGAGRSCKGSSSRRRRVREPVNIAHESGGSFKNGCHVVSGRLCRTKATSHLTSLKHFAVRNLKAESPVSGAGEWQKVAGIPRISSIRTLLDGQGLATSKNAAPGCDSAIVPASAWHPARNKGAQTATSRSRAPARTLFRAGSMIIVRHDRGFHSC
jgi:hypothetical protein